MRDKKILTVAMGIFVIGVFVFSTMYVGFDFKLTGHAVFTEGPEVGQTILTLQDAGTDNLDDAYVDTDANHGGLALLKTGSIYKIYIKFNISLIPINQNIDNSLFCLYDIGTKKIQTINVSNVYSDWNESTITWSNQPCGADFDNSSACNLTAESFVQMDSTPNLWRCWNVTNMVRKDYSSGSNDVSMVLYTSDSDTNSFNSKEYTTDTSLIPYLNITYSSANSAPTITLVSPQDGASYGTNESLALNFSVSDTDDNIDSCWYNIGGENIIIPSCANTTFDIAEGSNTLNIYVNDTAGLETNYSVSFNVAVGAPSILLNSPIEAYLPSGQNIEFSYTPTDIDLASCWLLGNFNGNFQKNQTDTSLTSGSVNTFIINSLNDGTYLWNIGCNDSQGNSAVNGNKTFYIDTVNPSISINEPSGQKTSRTEISLNFDVSDNSPLSCHYDITTSIGTDVVNNIEIENCNNTSFDVSSDGDYILYLWATDSAENSESSNSSFSVDTSTSTPVTPPPVNSGGGGGGSIIFPRVSTLATLEIEKINVVASTGEEKNLLVNVKNVGSVSANKCSLVAGEDYEKYIDSNDLLNIGVGEIVEFMFVLNVLDENVEKLDLSIKCLENVSAEIPIEITIWQPDLDVSIVEISFKSDDKLLVAYNIEPTDSSTRSLLFKISNSDGEIVTEISEDIELIFGQLYNGEILIDISDADEGMLKLAITDENEVNFIEENFIYGKSLGITGFSLANLDAESSYVGIILILFLILAVFLVIRIWKLKK